MALVGRRCGTRWPSIWHMMSSDVGLCDHLGGTLLLSKLRFNDLKVTFRRPQSYVFMVSKHSLLLPYHSFHLFLVDQHIHFSQDAQGHRQIDTLIVQHTHRRDIVIVHPHVTLQIEACIITTSATPNKIVTTINTFFISSSFFSPHQ